MAPCHRGGRHRDGAHPLGAHLRGQARALPHVLRPQPGHHAHGRSRRGRRHHRRAVDRRAGHAAHAAHVPHRRHRRPHRRADPRRKSKVAGIIEYGDRLLAVTNPEGQRIVTSYEGELIIRTSVDRNAAVGARLAGAARRHADGVRRRRGEARPGRSSPGIPYTNPIIADVEGDDPVRRHRRGRDRSARSSTSSPDCASASSSRIARRSCIRTSRSGSRRAARRRRSATS